MDNINTKKNIGYRLATLFDKTNKKQKELAEYLEVKPNVVSYFVNGERVPNTEQVIKIATFFNVSTDYLLGLTDVTTTDKDLKFICDCTGLSEKSVHILYFFKNSECIIPITNLLLESEGGAILRELGYFLEELSEEEAKEICIDRSKLDKVKIQEYETVQLLSRLENYVMFDKSKESELLAVTKSGKIISLDGEVSKSSENTFTSFEDLIPVEKIKQNDLIEKILFDNVIEGIEELKRQVNPNGKHNKKG